MMKVAAGLQFIESAILPNYSLHARKSVGRCTGRYCAVSRCARSGTFGLSEGAAVGALLTLLHLDDEVTKELGPAVTALVARQHEILWKPTSKLEESTRAKKRSTCSGVQHPPAYPRAPLSACVRAQLQASHACRVYMRALLAGSSSQAISFSVEKTTSASADFFASVLLAVAGLPPFISLSLALAASLAAYIWPYKPRIG